jgi:hypothetical protein
MQSMMVSSMHLGDLLDFQHAMYGALSERDVPLRAGSMYLGVLGKILELGLFFKIFKY